MTAPRHFALWHARCGWLGVVAGEEALLEVVFTASRAEAARRIAARYPQAREGGGALLQRSVRQIEGYLRGERRSFDLPLDRTRLSPFAAEVMDALCRVPYGETVSYGELAALAGHPGAARAVGRVMADNPFPVVVPCHRVTAAGGRPGGYSGGTGGESKAWLLRLEGG